MTQNYTEGYEYLSSQFPEVSGYDFYREMFPNNERSDEWHMDYSHPKPAEPKNNPEVPAEGHLPDE